VGDRIVFSAGAAEHGWEIWQSDGSSTGTVLLKDLRPGKASSYPNRFTQVDDMLFFVADVFFVADDEAGIERLWRIDAAGAVSAVSMVDPARPQQQ
jgi:ELWxxDGT repeat protein